MKQIKYVFLILSVFQLFFSGLPVHADEGKQKVYVIPVEGMVEPGMAAYVKRSLESLKDETDAVFVFKLDTFGGRVDSAFDIVDSISDIPKGKTIAFVEKRAISAGALIALRPSSIPRKAKKWPGRKSRRF